MKSLYSLVGTSYNTVQTVRPCLLSIINHLETNDIELVVCDSFSTDGTPEAIREFRPFFKRLKVISQRCSRGKGRQVAFEHSTGTYIIQFDLDAFYNEGLVKLFEWHKKESPDYAIIAGNSIYPRNLIERVGGWRDLNWSEDLDIWIRLTLTGQCKWYGYETNYNTHLTSRKNKQKHILFRIKGMHRNLRDVMALHRTSLTIGVRKYGLNPTIFLFLISKFSSFAVRNVVDVRRYSRKSIIDKNLIDLGLSGEKFVWYSNGFILDSVIKNVS
jgi:glycosyltransferase involved in cell wall biosynthesis